MAKIQNVVISAKLNKKLELKKMAEQWIDSKFNASRFPGLRLKIDKVAFLLFSSGKLICLGSKSTEQARATIEELLHKLASFGYSGYYLTDFSIANIVASGNQGYKIRLDQLHSAHIQNCLWDQESFPGLRYRFEEFHITITCFANGQYYLTGVKRIEDIKSICCIFENIAKQYKCLHQ